MKHKTKKYMYKIAFFRCNKIVVPKSSVDAMKASWITLTVLGFFYVI